MSLATFYIGDVFEVLATLPDDSVDLCFTSPPFLNLRNYLPDDHADKGRELGSEATPGEFIDALLDVVEATDRVLAPHGSIVFELGDTASGSGGHGGDYEAGGMREGQPKFDGSARARSSQRPRSSRPKYQGVANEDGRRSRAEDEEAGILQPRYRGSSTQRDTIEGWPLDKSLCLVPELFRFSLAYGFNPLTGRSTPRWRVRNVIRWCRPNPSVGALGDKFRWATSDLVVACKSKTRYFDLDAVRTPLTEPGAVKTHSTHAPNERQGWGGNNAAIVQNENGAPPLDHWWIEDEEDTFRQDAWLISTQPFKGSHYAVMASEVVIKPVKAMCPERVCTECGQPSRRIVELEPGRGGDHPGRNGGSSTAMGRIHTDSRQATTIGWSDCGHGSWRAGVVLDPFAGSGTSGVVATGHGRDAVLIDLDARNADLARERIGMFLTVVEGRPQAPVETVD